MLLENSPKLGWVERLPWIALCRWWAVGLSFYLAGLCMLYVSMDVARMPLLGGTLLVAEVTTIVRYAINDRWVFGEQRLSWSRLWQFHVANVGGFTIWWVATNILARSGVHYLLASTAGTACSVLFSMLTNFLWIWRKKPPETPTGDAAPN
jgi:putative flippase GtrA